MGLALLDRLAHSWTSEIQLDAAALAERNDLFIPPGQPIPNNRSIAALNGAFFTADGTRFVVPGNPQFRGFGPYAEPPAEKIGLLFDGKTGKLIGKLPSTGLVSPDGTWVASPVAPGGQTRVYRLTEVATGRQVEGDLGPIVGMPEREPVRVGPDGQRATAASVEWAEDLVQGPDRFRVGRHQFQPIVALHLTVWTAEKGSRTTRFAGPRDGLALVDFELSPDGTTAVLVRQRILADPQLQPTSTPRETSIEFIDLTVTPPVSRATHKLQAGQTPPLQSGAAGSRVCVDYRERTDGRRLRRRRQNPSAGPDPCADSRDPVTEGEGPSRE